MTEGPDPIPETSFTPGEIVELAALGALDINIDDPQYRAVRYSDPPTNGVLNNLMKIYNHITDHQGERFTQTQIADAIGTSQGKVSEIMNNYPNIFGKSNGIYYVGEMPETFRQAFEAANGLSDGPRVFAPGLTVNERAIQDKLNKLQRTVNLVLAEITKPVETVETKQQSTVESNSHGKIINRPYLDAGLLEAIRAKFAVNTKPLELAYKTVEIKAMPILIAACIALLDDADMDATMEYVATWLANGGKPKKNR